MQNNHEPHQSLEPNAVLSADTTIEVWNQTMVRLKRQIEAQDSLLKKQQHAIVELRRESKQHRDLLATQQDALDRQGTKTYALVKLIDMLEARVAAIETALLPPEKRGVAN